MSYVLRLHAKGAEGESWYRSTAYTDREIEDIRDPEGGTGSFLPTAIPSPFARFDLVQTAFLNLSRTSALKTQQNGNVTLGSREEEKLVSDALDVLELLFNRDSLGNELRIIPWEPATELKNLGNGGQAQRRVGDALGMYLRQDSAVYNFDRMQRLYLVYFNHQVIGCTSPVTLTAASGNELHNANIRIAGDYQLFDSSYDPLYRRAPEFQLFVYRMFEAHNELKGLRSVQEYLRVNKDLLRTFNPGLLEKINTIRPGDYAASYNEIDTGRPGDVVEVLGVRLRKRKADDIYALISQSDFVIAARNPIQGIKPLVLQNDLAKPFKYVQENWQRAEQVPYADMEADLAKRWLPGLKIQYPYLTVSDFLEPFLVRLVYPVDSTRYFDGNLSIETGNKHVGYLLPVRNRFFEYFSVTDLLNVHPDGQPWFRLRQVSAENVVAELRIPVQREGEYITLTRMYSPAGGYEAPKANEEENKGMIVEHRFGVSLFPFLRSNDPGEIPPHYRVQLVDTDIAGIYRDSTPDLQFLEKGSVITPKRVGMRGRKEANGQYSSCYYGLEKEFDAISVKTKYANGLIIPKWPKPKNGNHQFSFAIDFGTSNTHIEYSSSVNNQPLPFSFSEEENDMQIAPLFDRKLTTEDFGGTGAYLVQDMIDKEFIPMEIRPDHNYRFPQRTVIMENKGNQVLEDMMSLSDFNISFSYEKFSLREHADVTTNLKWKGQEQSGKVRIRIFFEQLMLMMRNKVLMNGGNLPATRLVWSYPFSMPRGKVGELEAMINEHYANYFNAKYDKNSEQNRANPLVTGLPESFGPFYYYQATGRLSGGTFTRPALSIDIGGGTSDVVLFKGGEPVLGSSFRFAANALFGGFLNESATGDNGMLMKYLPTFSKRFEDYQYFELRKVLKELEAQHSAADTASFLFSLENNRDIKDSRPFNFNSMLSGDDDLRIVFLFFYAAMLYHIAQLVRAYYEKAGQAPVVPGNILFSGTGSKLLQVITPDTNLMAQFAGLVFADVFGQDASQPVTVILEKNFPKAATSKGGLYFLRTGQHQLDFKSIELVHHPAASEKVSVTYDAVNDKFFREYDAALHTFAKKFMEWNDVFSYKNHLNVSAESWSTFTRLLFTELDTTQDGFVANRRADHIAGDSKEVVSETLFFYPIIRTINAAWKPLADLRQPNT